MGFLLKIECCRLRGVSVQRSAKKVLWLCVGASEREHGVNRAAGRTLQRKSLRALWRPDWHRSAWTRRDIVQADDTKVHVVTTFVRLREDGGQIASYDSLYVLTYQDDRWAIKGRSSFAP